MTEVQTPVYVDGPPPNLADQGPVQQDYFGFSRAAKYWFPDKITYFDLKAMNEGDKKEFQKLTTSDMVLERRTGDARMKADLAVARHEKIKKSVVGWNLKRGDTMVPFRETAMRDFLTLADPTLIEDIEKEINKLNPWMLGEMTSDDIQKEIDNLTEMKEVALERERGEESSSDKQSSS